MRGREEKASNMINSWFIPEKLPEPEQIENKAAYIVKLIYYYSNILLYIYKWILLSLFIN